MKTGISTSTIIHAKSKKNKFIKCNCNKCVNHGRKGCHHGLSPINGMCGRYGINDYNPTKEEKEQSKSKQQLFKEKEKEKIQGLETVTIEKVDLSQWKKYK